MPQKVITGDGTSHPISTGTERAGQMLIQYLGAGTAYYARDTAAVSGSAQVLAGGTPNGASINWTTPTNLSSWNLLIPNGDKVVVIYD